MAALDKTAPSYYVAIGASAGGLEALQEFFKHMPCDLGVAFIVIQHLSPDFKSVMDELLGRCTKMDIEYASDGLVVNANTIYLIPPRKHMMIAEGKLLLTDQMPHSGLNFPIDIFFRSLAEDQYHRSIGIILSGTGSDGSRGLRAIKEVSGLIMVQEPSNAKFDGMPYSAVNTGLADVVADSQKLPEKLIQYINHPMMRNQEQSLVNQVAENDSAFEEIFSLLRQRSDIDFTQYKATTVARRIERRLGVNGLNSLHEYHALLLKKPSEIQTLAKDMLIGVTRFFRDDEAFTILEQQAIPEILKSTPKDEPIRVWVAGCSTGEEAYSIAILFDEAMQARGASHQIKIFATDVDPDAIAEASSGRFKVSVKEDMSDERANTYFTIEEDAVVIAPHIRQMLVFATHNLINDPPFSNTHLAVCRNVLIYFQSAAQKRVLSMLHFSLKKNGFLFLGASESLGEMAPYFETIHERSRLFRKSVTTRTMQHALGDVPTTKEKQSTPPSVEQLLRHYQNRNTPHHIGVPMTESLIQEYVPTCIILNQDLEIIHGYGDASPFTKKYQTGKFSANIKKVIIDALSVAVSTAIQKAISEQSDVVYPDIRIQQDNNKILQFDLRVHYVKIKAIDSFQVALIFDTTRELRPEEHSEIITYNASEQSQQRINDLELQLQKNQEHLQVTVEELETTNEELQSSNEELLAANEELQSTNEELQSVNEELYTVNSEYQAKIEEISSINTDLDNIMVSTDIGILFLDDAMLIRNFTPAITRDIHVLKTDIGRPFHHISHQLSCDTLLQDIAKVIETEQPIERKVNSSDNRLVLLKISSYINERNEKYGCVISITDITESSTLHTKLEESYQQLENSLTSMMSDADKNVRVAVISTQHNDAVLLKEYFGVLNQTQEHFDVNIITDFGNACDQLRQQTVDVCLIDYSLEDKTGFDLITELNNQPNLPPFILLCSDMTDDLYQSAIKLGIFEVLDISELSPRLIERTIKHALHLQKIKDYLRNTVD